jgi:hypothetical protein
MPLLLAQDHLILWAYGPSQLAFSLCHHEMTGVLG